jgi:Ca-activated chloride channel homolog
VEEFPVNFLYDPESTFAALRFSILGYAVQFARPEALFLIAAAALFGIWAIGFALVRRGWLRRLAHSHSAGLIFPGASPRRRGVRGSLASLSLMLFALALAKPQCGSRTELAKRRGIELVIAIDGSKSMLARDIKPSRIERAKLELTSLLDRLGGDRVAVVAFAGDAFVQCPLTTDYAAAKMFLQAVDVLSMPVGGTNIARALEVSRNLIEEAERTPAAKAIVLITDGEDNAGDDVEAELDKLKAEDIRVYPVGVGSTAGEPIPEYDSKGNFLGYQRDPKTNQTIMSRLDEEGLIHIANVTGGKYVASRAGTVGVGEVYEEINNLQKAESESRLTIRYVDRFELFLVPGFLLLLVAWSLRPASRREAMA